MGLMDAFLTKANKTLRAYTGDKSFLVSTCSAAAFVIAADGKIDDAEKEAAISGILANKAMAGSFKPAEIEGALREALTNTTTFAGKTINKRAIQDAAGRDPETRQDIFLIAADCANADDNIGDEEKIALTDLAKLLNVDSKALIGF